MSKPNGILAMDPEHYREIDGVVFDLESYERHFRHQEVRLSMETPPTPAAETAAEPAEPQQNTAPAPVFAAPPYPAGWYPGAAGTPPVPIMGGACQAVETMVTEDGRQTVMQTVFLPSGSGSGSYLSSYTISFSTSFTTSFVTSGSFIFGSGSCLAHGYGLELI